MTENLWGTLPEKETTRTPYTVLLEQAAYLRKMTNGLLIGNVKRRSIPPKNPFEPEQRRGELKLLIVAPALDNYSYGVVTLTYPVTTLYPVTVEYDSRNVQPITCQSEEELLPVLKGILSSERTQRVIASLLMQIRSDTPEEEEMVA